MEFVSQAGRNDSFLSSSSVGQVGSELEQFGGCCVRPASPTLPAAPVNHDRDVTDRHQIALTTHSSCHEPGIGL